MTFKKKIFDHYLHILDDKIKLLQNVLEDLKESGTNETKSTAGDKHETALAMLQIEQANIRGQLNDAQDKMVTMKRINPLIPATRIVNGSLIKTNRGFLFLSIGLGKATIEDTVVIALSAQSPLGKLLIGLAAGDKVEISNNKYVIESVE
ncbi:MAG: hypothetical protein H0W12_11925 [Chitinophagaceae bacterium]|nr:hypothetical protein [Chitinophagaceae bacterium]